MLDELQRELDFIQGEISLLQVQFSAMYAENDRLQARRLEILRELGGGDPT